MYALRSTCISHIVWHHSSMCHVTCDHYCDCTMWYDWCVTVWFCHSNPSSKNRIKGNKLKIKIRKENKKKLSLLLLFLTTRPFQQSMA